MAVTQPPPPPAADVEFVYVGDPMCSWCWGFVPVLEAIGSHYTIPIRTVVGGLRPGPSAQPLDDRMREMLTHHWEQVAERSGQPFDYKGLDRDGWLYDTELPARAVTVMRRLAPDDTLPFFTRLQRAFYAEAVDITSPDVYPALIEHHPVDQQAFMAGLTADASKRAAWEDFDEARRLGVTGFPALLLRLDHEYFVVARGYLPWDQLESALSSWLRDRFGATEAAGLFCDIDGVC